MLLWLYPGRRALIAYFPRSITVSGLTMRICSLRYWQHARISSGLGFLFFGGWHLITDVMYTFFRSMSAISSSLSKNSPALPTNGQPVLSSFFPREWPTIMSPESVLHSPGTAFVLVSDRRQLFRSMIFLFRFSNSDNCLDFFIIYVNVIDLILFML